VSLPLFNVVTLGARDLDRLRSFYVALGWPHTDVGDLALFELAGGVLGVFPIGDLARDARSAPAPLAPGLRFTMELLVPEASQVDELAARVEAAGGTITKQPADAEFFVGRNCYFADPEGNVFEIAWAPDDNPVVAAALRAQARTR
jgi:catechol 2,3-dioxygenase-like lactoylglutathione lyase family enzyme